jgi:hypothetical protein
VSQLKEKKSLITWVKEHKTELIFLGATAVVTILVAKNWDSIKDSFESDDFVISPAGTIESVVEKVVVPIISNEILDNQSGDNFMAKDFEENNKAIRATITIDDDRWAKHPYGVEFDDNECNSRFHTNRLDSRVACYRVIESARAAGFDIDERIDVMYY